VENICFGKNIYELLPRHFKLSFDEIFAELDREASPCKTEHLHKKLLKHRVDPITDHQNAS